MNGNTPQQKWSVNFTSMQMLAWMIAKLAALIVGMWCGISFVASYQFEQSLSDFHEVAKPEIGRLIDEKISTHQIVAETPLIERLHKIENQAGQYDERMKALKENSDRNTEELKEANRKLDRIIERLANK